MEGGIFVQIKSGGGIFCLKQKWRYFFVQIKSGVGIFCPNKKLRGDGRAAWWPEEQQVTLGGSLSGRCATLYNATLYSAPCSPPILPHCPLYSAPSPVLPHIGTLYSAPSHTLLCSQSHPATDNAECATLYSAPGAPPFCHT